MCVPHIIVIHEIAKKKSISNNRLLIVSELYVCWWYIHLDLFNLATKKAYAAL